MRRDRGKKSGSPVILAGLGGFLLGAATILLVVWIYTTQSGSPLAPASGGFIPIPAPTPAPAPQPPQTSPPPAAPPAVSSFPVDLASRNLLLPVQGISPEQLQDTFNDMRDNGGRRHEALDIMAPRGTPVLATDAGTIAKLFTSKQGGLTIYEFDTGATYAYYYAHLDRYADGLREGDTVRRGQVMGYVGSTGNADSAAPHLHFTIFHLTPEKQWWKGDAVDPFGLLR